MLSSAAAALISCTIGARKEHLKDVASRRLCINDISRDIVVLQSIVVEKLQTLFPNLIIS
jgi:hypothetical protein